MRRLACSLLFVFALLVTGARADDATIDTLAAATHVRDGAARRLVSTFNAAVKAARNDESTLVRRQNELAALRELTAGRHVRVAKRLAKAAADHGLDVETRLFALRALPLQGNGGKDQAKRVEKWLQAAATQDSDDRKRGRVGLPVDRRSGEFLVDTPEAKRALREGETRARLLAAGLAALRVLEHAPKHPADLIRPFLQSPYDVLAVAAVDAAQAWDARQVLDELSLLLRMYPRENRWETGAVTHIGGTNASAKATWMALFGHPLKQRARPAVHRAIVACVSAWAGKTISDPETCDAWIATMKR